MRRSLIVSGKVDFLSLIPDLSNTDNLRCRLVKCQSEASVSDELKNQLANQQDL